MVNPMPASTCWQWRAAVRAPRPARALAMAAAAGDRSSQAAPKAASAASMATSVVGQPVADGLEGGDGPAELDPLQGVDPGPAPAWPARRPPARGRRPAGPGPPPGPVAGLEVDGRAAKGTLVAGHLDQARGAGPCPGPAGATRSAVGTSRHDSSPSGAGHDPGGGGVDQCRAVPTPRTTRPSPATRPGGRHCPSAGRTTARRRAGPESQARSRRRRRAPTLWRWLVPCSSKRTDTARPGSSARAPRAIRARRGRASRAAPSAGPAAWRRLRSNSARSSPSITGPIPRSSSRRAMMLRWISAVPP